MKRVATAISWWALYGLGWEAVSVLGSLGAIVIFGNADATGANGSRFSDAAKPQFLISAYRLLTVAT
jgi:hypothetical protein